MWIFGWLAALGKGVVIESPEDVREEFKEWIRAVIREYENEGYEAVCLLFGGGNGRIVYIYPMCF